MKSCFGRSLAIGAAFLVASALSPNADAGGISGKYKWGSGSSTGTFQIIVGAVTEKLKAANPGLDFTLVPGGSVGNTMRMGGKGDFPIAMISGLPAKLGYRGELVVKGKKVGPYTKLRGIASIYFQHFQFVVPKELDAEYIEDVVEKKMKLRVVPGGPRGHLGVMAFRDVLSTMGVTYDDMEAWGAKIIYAEFSEATTGIQDGDIDMFTPLTAAPNGAITSLATQRPVKFLKMRPETMEKMKALGYGVGTLPANSYPGQDYDLTVSVDSASFFARTDTPEDLVHAVAKFVASNEAFMKSIHRRTKEDFTAAGAPLGLGMPLHPGAERAYKELGVLK